MGRSEFSTTAATTLPRLAALVRLLLQLRMLLAAIALLIAPLERQTVGIVLSVVAFALLSALAARYWERFVPYLLNHPLLVTLDVGIASGILAIDGPSGPMFLTTLLTATVAGLLFGWRGIVATAALQILCYAAALVAYAGMNMGESAELWTFQTLAVNPLLYPVAGYVGLRIRTVLRELAVEQEARRTAQLAAASADERARLARDMHDSVAKTLRGMAMAARSLPLWVEKNPERASTTALQVAEAADYAASEARELISGLREGPAAGSFHEAVSELVADWNTSAGLHTEVRHGESQLEPLFTARQESFAILKEALTNVERHANASSVIVTVSADEGHTVLSVTDDGQGFAQDPDAVRDAEQEGNGHFGVLGMTERARRAGGAITVESAPGHGTTIRLRVPASTENQAGKDPLASSQG